MNKPAKIIGVLWAIIIMFILLAVLATVTFCFTKTKLHIEQIETRATVSCTDHRAPKVRVMQNEPVVVVDCDPERKP